MVKETKFYDTFGVAPNAPIEEIKKKYKRLALQYHPDKNPDPAAAERFKEISYQYSILEDPEKRAAYDSYGEDGLKEGGSNMGDFDASDLFSRFFGGGGDIFGGGARSRRPQKGKDLQHELSVPLEQFYLGKTRRLAIKKKVRCSDCNAKGGEGVETCGDCKGQGVRMMIRQLGPGMITQQQVACQKCRASGEIMRGKVCGTCKGDKLIIDKKIIEIEIRPGMSSGEQLAYPGEGNHDPELPPGDLVIVLRGEAHPVFTRAKDTLAVELTISLVEALAGFNREITHLDGRKLLIAHQGGVIEPNSRRIICSEGMPQARNPALRGALIINFAVAFPSAITPDQAAALRGIFGQPASILPANDHYPVHLEPYNERATYAQGENRQHGRYDDDEDESHHHHQAGPQNVQCASQ